METIKRVLVVDDEPGILKFVAIKLRLCGYEVIITTSGAEAIELVRKHNPAVMLLDIVMPDVTGAEVLAAVRGFSQIPVIVFTARPEVFKMAKRFGANDYIAKPLNPDILVEKIRSVLSASRTKEKP